VIVTERDRLKDKVPDLATSAARPLAMRGVPRRVILPDWTGPTFFSSELADGHLRTLEAFAPALAESCNVSGWVLGTVREQMSWNGEDPLGAFLVQRGTGHVLLADLEHGNRPTFVNSSAGLFLDAIDVFLQWWETWRRRDPEVRRLRDDLTRLDAASLASAEHFWPQWLEDVRDL
jgi:SUKH-4 immunity protein